MTQSELFCGVMQNPTGNIVNQDAVGNCYIGLYAACPVHNRYFWFQLLITNGAYEIVLKPLIVDSIIKPYILCRAIAESVPGDLRNSACECMIAEHDKRCKHGAALAEPYKSEPCPEHDKEAP